MTNQERAIDVMMRSTYHSSHLSPMRHCEILVQALADAGLLMPDLPEPKRSHDDPKWQADYRESWEDEFGEGLTVPSVWAEVGENATLQVFPGDGQVQVYYDGEPEEPVDADEAWKIGLKWLAAAKLAEEQE